MKEVATLFETILSPGYFEQIENFKCSSEKDVELFLKEDALRLQQNNMATTRLFFNESNKLVGYFTLFNDIVPKISKEKRDKEQWSLPNSKFYPALRLHYIGVDERFQKKRYGEFLLMRVFDIGRAISEVSGCTFISVEALISAVGFYEHYDFRTIGKHDKRYLNMVFKLEELNEEY